MIRREDAHHRVLIGGLNDVRRKRDGRGGVALLRLRQNLVGGDLRKLAYDLRAQMIIGQNPNPFGR